MCDLGLKENEEQNEFGEGGGERIFGNKTSRIYFCLHKFVDHTNISDKLNIFLYL
jgi:hypothetical protein